MAAVFKLMDVGPYFRLPGSFVRRRLSASSAARMECHRSCFLWLRGARKLDKNAADFLDLFVFPKQVLVAKKVGETKFMRFRLRLRASVKRSILGA